MKDYDLRAMDRAELEDEVMLLRAQAKVLRNDLSRVVDEKDNEIWSLKRQLAALTCARSYLHDNQ